MAPDSATSLRTHASPDATSAFPEINIASLLDWPMQYVRLGIAQYKPTSYVLNMTIVSEPDLMDAFAQDGQSKHADGEQGIAHACSGRLAEQLKTSSDAYYLRYMPEGCSGWFSCRFRGLGGAYMAQRSAMYAEMNRALHGGPTEKELLGFGSLPQPNATADLYKACQVVWASKAESGTPSGAGADAPIHEKVLGAGQWQLEVATRSHHR